MYLYIVQICAIFFLMQKMFTSQHFLSGTDTGFLIGTLEHSVLGTWKHSFFGTCVMSRYRVSCLYHTTLRDCIVSSDEKLLKPAPEPCLYHVIGKIQKIETCSGTSWHFFFGFLLHFFLGWEEGI